MQSTLMPSRLFLAIVAIVIGQDALCPIFVSAQSPEERLSNLDPSRPEQYKRLAEDLAAKTGDPEAPETALRLFHIAAWLEPEKLATGSLRSMIAIARSPEEEKRLRAVVYLLDPSAEDTVLRTVATSNSATITPPPPELLRAVRLLRQGGRDSARQVIAAKSVQDFLGGESQRALRDELAALVTTNSLSERQLRRLLELELQWTQSLRSPGSGAAATANMRPWQELNQDALAATPTSPTLLSLTEFDPRENLYRNGRWVRSE